MITPTIKRRAKIVRSKTVRGSGYKVRLQYKQRIEEDGSIYHFIVTRWLDPKTNSTVFMTTHGLNESSKVKDDIKAVLTMEQTNEMMWWIINECQAPLLVEKFPPDFI